MPPRASCEKQCRGVQVENDCYGGWSCKVSNVGVIRLMQKWELFRNRILKDRFFPKQILRFYSYILQNVDTNNIHLS